MALLVTLAGTLLTVILRFALNSRYQLQAIGATALRLDPGTIITNLSSSILTGLLVYVVGEAVIGRRVSLGDAWQTAKSRLLPLIGFEIALGVVVLFLVLSVVGVLVLPLTVYLILVPAVIVLERLSIGAAIKRSVSLIRGAFWRTLGIVLLSAILVAIVAGVLSAPLIAVGLFLASTGGLEPQASTVIYLVEAAVGLLAGTLVTPFTAGVNALLYVDRRMRTEGLDVTLARHVMGHPHPGP